MSRWDIAEWRGPVPNQGGRMLEQRGLVVHIAEGSYEGTIAWQKNPTASVSSHFVVRADGHIAQCVDSDVAAWTQRDGNGRWLSVENEGHTPRALTDAQVEANARLLAYGAKLYGYPLTLAGSPAGRGLGYHSMGAEHGYNWGHSDCPGPAIKAQLPTILARAIVIAGGSTGGGSTDMIFAISDGTRKGYAGKCGGGCYQFAANGAQLEQWRKDQGGAGTVYVPEAQFADRVGIVDTVALAKHLGQPANDDYITADEARAIFEDELADVDLVLGKD